MWSLCPVVEAAAPTITSVSPMNSPATGGGGFVPLVLHGTGFGNTIALISVSIGTFESPQISFVADGANGAVIMARLPAGVGAGHDVFVYVEGIAGAMVNSFSYDAPRVTALSPGTVPTSGGTLTVLGINFGVDNYAQSSSSGGSDLETLWVSDSTFKSTVLAGTGASKDLTCSVVSQLHVRPAAFSYAQPLITSLTLPIATTTGGGPMTTILGANFGMANSSPHAKAGFTAAATTQWISDVAVRGRAARGVGGALDVVVEVDGQRGTKVAAICYGAPVVTYVSPVEVATTGRTTLTVLGSSFGSFDSSIAASVGISECLQARWTSDSSLLCLVAAGTGGARGVSARVASQSGTLVGAVRYVLPHVTLLTPATGPTSGGYSVTVFGSSFGTYDSTPTLQVGASFCTVLTYVSDSSLVCRLAVGMGGGLGVIANVNGQTRTARDMYSFTSVFDCVLFIQQPAH